MKEISTARAIHLRHDQAVPVAMRRVVAECVRQLEGNVSLIEELGGGDDAECVHQARVALRRLRSADKAFSKANASSDWQALVETAQWLAGLLGKLRDLQILLTVTLPPIATAHVESIDFEPLRVELTLRSERARNHLRRALRSKRYRAWLHGLQLWLDTESETARTRLPTFASKSLSRSWRKVDALIANWESLDQTQRHILRKRVKKLRYAIEFFAALYAPKAVEKYLKQLKAMLNALGVLNDTAAAQALLRPLLRNSETALAASAAVGWLTCASRAQIDAVTAEISGWQRYRPFW